MPWARFNTGNCTWTCTTLLFFHSDFRRNLWSLKGGASPKEQNITIRTVTCYAVQVLKLRDLESPNTSLPSEYRGRNKHNKRATEHVISFDTWKLLHVHSKESLCLFGFSVPTWKMEDIRGASLSEPQGSGKEWLEYVVDSLSLEVFENGLTNPFEEWGSTADPS